MKKLLLLLTVILGIIFSGNTQTEIVGWDFSTLLGGTGNFGPSPMSPTTHSENVTIIGLTRSEGLGTSGTAAAGAWGATNYTPSGTLASEISINKFWTFSITPNSGQVLSLFTINEYNIRRSSTGPTSGQWQYQIGSGEFINIGATLNYPITTSSGNSLPAFDLSGISDLQNVSEGNTITFRLVNFGATGSAGTCYYKDLGNSTANDLSLMGTLLVSTITNVDDKEICQGSTFVNLSAIVSPDPGSGKVQFSIDGNNLGSPQSIEQGGGITYTYDPSTLAPGNHDIGAYFEGNEYFHASGGNATLSIVTSPAVLPYSEDFLYSAWPTCWTQTSTLSDRWSIENTNDAGGLPYEMMASWTEGIGVSRLISPELNLEGTTFPYLIFRQAYFDYGPGCTIGIQTSTDGGLSWYTEWFYNTGTGNIPQEKKEISISNFGSNTLIAWFIEGDHYNIDFWFVDNILVQDGVPCLTPIDQHVESITTNSALLSWTEVGTATNWDIEYGPSGFEPTGNPSIDCDDITNNTDFLLTNLQDGTLYSWYLRSDCGEDNSDVSEWKGPNTFQTQCLPKTTFPYIEDFNEGLFPPLCWSQIITNPVSTWRYNPDGYAECIHWQNQDEWLITPEFDFSLLSNPYLSFDWRTMYYWMVSPNDNGDIYCRISIDNGVSWTTLWSEDEEPPFYWIFYTKVIDLSTYAGQSSVKFAFQYIVPTTYAEAIYIDNFLVNNIEVTYSQINATCFGESDGSIDLTVTGGSGNYSYLWSPGNQTTQDLTGIPAGTYTVTVTDVDYGLNVEKLITINQPDAIPLSGYYHYYNSSSTALNGVSVELQQSGAYQYGASTNSSGYFEFANVCPGTYDVVASKTKVNTGINSTDAAQVNYWSVHNSGIETVRFLGGDVNGDHSVVSSDASHIQQYFITQGSPAQTFASDWSFWKTGEMINANPGPSGFPTITVPAGAASITQNFYGLVTGDFNRSYVPGSLKSGSESLSLIYGDVIVAGMDIQFELPLYATANMEVSAISLILEFPADLMELNGVYLSNDPTNPVPYLVSGDEIRIGWNSLTPLMVQEGEPLVTLLLKVNEPAGEDGIRFKLASDPLNELADGSFEVISDAVLMVDIIQTTATGFGENGMTDKLTLSNNPNPFWSTTNFSYSLPVDGKVTLEIYDIVGNKVKVLVDEMQTAGEYKLKMEKSDLQPGVFTVTLRLMGSEAFMSQTIKIIHKNY